MERRQLELILDQVADIWFVGNEQPTTASKLKQKVAKGKERPDGYPQLLKLRDPKIQCPTCLAICEGRSSINLRTGRQKFSCGCERFFRGFYRPE